MKHNRRHPSELLVRKIKSPKSNINYRDDFFEWINNWCPYITWPQKTPTSVEVSWRCWWLWIRAVLGQEYHTEINHSIFLPLIKPEDALELLFFSQLQFLFKFTWNLYSNCPSNWDPSYVRINAAIYFLWCCCRGGQPQTAQRSRSWTQLIRGTYLIYLWPAKSLFFIANWIGLDLLKPFHNPRIWYSH